MQQRVASILTIAASATIALAACSPGPGSGDDNPSEMDTGPSETSEFDGSKMVVGQDALTIVPPSQSSSGKPTDLSRLEIEAGEMQNGLCNAQIEVFFANDEAKQRLLAPKDAGDPALLDDVFQVSSGIDSGREGHGEVSEDGSTVTVDFKCATSDEPMTSGEATSSSAVFTDVEAQGQTAFRWAFTVNSTGTIIPTETGQLAGTRMTLGDDGVFVQS